MPSVWATVLLSIVIIWSQYEAESAKCPPDPHHPRAETRLRQKLFCDYDRRALPVANSNRSIQLSVTYQIQVATMDEDDHKFKLKGPMHFIWQDVNLRWLPNDYEGIMYIQVDEGKIWNPDLTFLSPTGGYIILKPRSCVVWFSGGVQCLPQMTLSAPCTVNSRYYPFDDHKCFLTASVVHYSEEQVNITNIKFDTSMYQPDMAKWNIENVTSSWSHVKHSRDNKTSHVSYFEIEFILRRYSAAAFAGYVLPGIAILILMLVTFWLGEKTTCRIAINVFNIMASYLFLCNSFYRIRPNGDDVPVLITLYRDGLSLSVFGIIMAVLHKILKAATNQPPLFISALTDWLDASVARRILFLSSGSRPIRDDEATIIEADAKVTKPNAWAPLAVLLDRVAFLIALLVTFILMLGYIPTEDRQNTV